MNEKLSSYESDTFSFGVFSMEDYISCLKVYSGDNIEFNRDLNTSIFCFIGFD